MTPARVVIVGAGFSGLSAAKALAGRTLDATIIDQHNDHLFQPLLYRGAIAGLSPAEIASSHAAGRGADRRPSSGARHSARAGDPRLAARAAAEQEVRDGSLAR